MLQELLGLESSLQRPGTCYMKLLEITAIIDPLQIRTPIAGSEGHSANTKGSHLALGSQVGPKLLFILDKVERR